MVRTHHRQGGISRRHRDDAPCGSTLQVDPVLLHSRENFTRLHNILGTNITPFDVGGIFLLDDGDGFPVFQFRQHNFSDQQFMSYVMVFSPNIRFLNEAILFR